jgi:Rieske 2Fe-2S family protein
MSGCLNRLILCLAVAGQSILLVRNREGRVRAFTASAAIARGCAAGQYRRRAVPLRAGLPGGTIVCPHHGWTYSLDGQLLKAPHLMPAAPLIVRTRWPASW